MRGLILGGLDLQIGAPALTSEELIAAARGGCSDAVSTRVISVRARQRVRGWQDAHLPNAALMDACALDPAGRRLVTDAVDRGGMSERGSTAQCA